MIGKKKKPVGTKPQKAKMTKKGKEGKSEAPPKEQNGAKKKVDSNHDADVKPEADKAESPTKQVKSDAVQNDAMPAEVSPEKKVGSKRKTKITKKKVDSNQDADAKPEADKIESPTEQVNPDAVQNDAVPAEVNSEKKVVTKKTKKVAPVIETPPLIETTLNYDASSVASFRDVADKLLEVYDFETCPIVWFDGVGLLENATSLRVTNGLFTSFRNAVYMPKLRRVSFKGSPVSFISQYRLMTLLAFGEQIEEIDDIAVSDGERILLSYTGRHKDEVVGFVRSGGRISGRFDMSVVEEIVAKCAKLPSVNVPCCMENMISDSSEYDILGKKVRDLRKAIRRCETIIDDSDPRNFCRKLKRISEFGSVSEISDGVHAILRDAFNDAAAGVGKANAATNLTMLAEKMPNEPVNEWERIVAGLRSENKGAIIREIIKKAQVLKREIVHTMDCVMVFEEIAKQSPENKEIKGALDLGLCPKLMIARLSELTQDPELRSRLSDARERLQHGESLLKTLSTVDADISLIRKFPSVECVQRIATVCDKLRTENEALACNVTELRNACSRALADLQTSPGRSIPELDDRMRLAFGRCASLVSAHCQKLHDELARDIDDAESSFTWARVASAEIDAASDFVFSARSRLEKGSSAGWYLADISSVANNGTPAQKTFVSLGQSRGQLLKIRETAEIAD